MARRVTIPVKGGLYKSVRVDTQQSAGTTIAGFDNQIVTLDQLRAALGLNNKATVTPPSGGGTSSASLIVAPGLVGGGPLVGSVPLRINKAQAAAMFVGGGGDDEGGGGAAPPGKPGKPGPQGPIGATGAAGTPGGPRGHAVAIVTEPEDPPSPILVRGPRGIAGPTGAVGPVRPLKIWMPDEAPDEPMFVGRAKASAAATSSLFNVDADTHPASPTAWDDEFEFGTTLDTSGARRAGANAWTLWGSDVAANWPVAQGSIRQLSGANVATMAVPAGSWQFTIKRYFQATGGDQFGFVVGNRTTGKAYNIFQFTNNLFYIQLGNITSSWVYSFNSNLINGGALAFQVGAYYLQITYNGTTLTAAGSSYGLPGTFSVYATRTVATDLGGAPLEIGIGIFTANSNMDFFRRTA